MTRNCVVTSTAVVGLLVCAGLGRAAIVEDFRFNDPNGTLLEDAENTANPGNHWLVHERTVESAVLNGSFRIQKQSENLLAGNSLNIDNITSGKAWLVAEIAGWHYTAEPSSPSERVRFGFLDNDPPAPGSSIVTAEMNIDRGPNGLQLVGGAIGSGSTNPAGSYDMPLTRSTPLTIALELDKDADIYEVFYREALGAWNSIGTGDLGERSAGVTREGRSVRFAFTGTFGEPGEFFDVSRIYVTTSNPIPEPGGLALAGLAAMALLVWRRRGR